MYHQQLPIVWVVMGYVPAVLIVTIAERVAKTLEISAVVIYTHCMHACTYSISVESSQIIDDIYILQFFLRQLLGLVKKQVILNVVTHSNRVELVVMVIHPTVTVTKPVSHSVTVVRTSPKSDVSVSG